VIGFMLFFIGGHSFRTLESGYHSPGALRANNWGPTLSGSTFRWAGAKLVRGPLGVGTSMEVRCAPRRRGWIALVSRWRSLRSRAGLEGGHEFDSHVPDTVTSARRPSLSAPVR